MICVERRTSVPAVRERERAVRPRLDEDMETMRVRVFIYSAAAYRAASSDGRDTRSKAVGPSRRSKRYDLQDPLITSYRIRNPSRFPSLLQCEALR